MSKAVEMMSIGYRINLIKYDLVEIREETALNYRIISKFASIIAAYYCKSFSSLLKICYL